MRVLNPIKKVVVCFLMFFIFALWIQSADALTRFLRLRHWSAPSTTRVVVDLTGDVKFKAFQLKAPPRLVVDIERALLPEPPLRVFPIGDTLIKRVRVARYSRNVIRVVLDLQGSAFKGRTFLLPRFQERPYRLVIDVENPDLNKKIQKERMAVGRGKRTQERIVVIDPGHGGEDPGAIGPRGTREKDVVLSIAKMVKAALDRQPHVRAFLTRKGDYFLSLRKRVRVAQEYGADLFLSLHTDASMSRRTRGASVYCLSLRGATDEAARILAERENSSDLVGGVPLNGDDDLNSILLDLVQTQTINDSLRWGGLMLRELERIHTLKFSMPRQAGFRVLRAPDIPSLLVEVGFITNPREERLLRSRPFKRRLAEAISSATLRYLCQQERSRPDHLALGFCKDLKPKAHIVSPGQNLTQIAAMYDTSVESIKKVNGLKDTSKIYAGQTLKIP
jgi:N-acetylmuramoyl-L-alanine amidase